MWWKSYFWSLVGVLGLNLLATFALEIKHLYMVVFDTALLALICVGVYSYVFGKKIKYLNPTFWKIFFWLNVVYSLLYIVYLLAPNDPLISKLSYLQSVETENSGWLELAISAVFSAPLFYALFRLSQNKFRKQEVKKKVALKKKKDSKGVKVAKWSLALGVVAALEGALLLGYGMLLNVYKWPEESAFAYLFFVALIPILVFASKMQRMALHHLCFALLGSLFVVGMTFGLVAVAPAEQPVPNAQTSKLSEKEVFEAINAKRKQNNVKPLGYDESTCALAKTRVDEVTTKGIELFGQSASFQRAIDRVFETDSSIDREAAPDFYQEFLTYQENAQDAISYWNDYPETNVLFTDPSYHVGCVGYKNGYAILVVGTHEQTESEDKTYFQTETYPKAPEKVKGDVI